MLTFGIGLLLIVLVLVASCGFNAYGGNGDGGKTQTAGTVIQYLVPPDRRGKTRITTVVYTDTGTSHTLTFLRPLGKTTVAAAAAASQTDFVLTANPGTTAAYGGISNGIAANDFVAIRTASDGITRLYKVSSVSTLTVTLTGNLTVALAAGDDVWFFGAAGDTDGRSGSAHPALKGGAASGDVTFTDREGGVVATFSADEPILFNSNNATNAGTLKQISWAYSAS
jgi:hypothetical protein